MRFNIRMIEEINADFKELKTFNWDFYHSDPWWGSVVLEVDHQKSREINGEYIILV